MKTIYDYSYAQLEELMLAKGQKKYRANQIFSWLYQKRVTSFDEMSDVARSFLDELKNELIRYSQEIGIDVIGFSDVQPFMSLTSELKRREDLGWSSNLTKGSIEERTNPLLSMSHAKSFISIGVSYPRKTTMPKQNSEDPFVQFSRSSWGMDYHEIVSNKL